MFSEIDVRISRWERCQLSRERKRDLSAQIAPRQRVSSTGGQAVDALALPTRDRRSSDKRVNSRTVGHGKDSQVKTLVQRKEARENTTPATNSKSNIQGAPKQTYSFCWKEKENNNNNNKKKELRCRNRIKVAALSLFVSLYLVCPDLGFRMKGNTGKFQKALAGSRVPHKEQNKIRPNRLSCYPIVWKARQKGQRHPLRVEGAQLFRRRRHNPTNVTRPYSVRHDRSGTRQGVGRRCCCSVEKERVLPPSHAIRPCRIGGTLTILAVK